MEDSPKGPPTQGQNVTKLSSAPDIFSGARGKPVLGAAGETKRYVGRVVVELWEPIVGEPEDYRFMAFTAEAVDGNHKDLAERVGSALMSQVSRTNFRT
jgi:hypothetical protein